MIFLLRRNAAKVVKIIQNIIIIEGKKNFIVFFEALRTIFLKKMTNFIER